MNESHQSHLNLQCAFVFKNDSTKRRWNRKKEKKKEHQINAGWWNENHRNRPLTLWLNYFQLISHFDRKNHWRANSFKYSMIDIFYNEYWMAHPKCTQFKNVEKVITIKSKMLNHFQFMKRKQQQKHWQKYTNQRTSHINIYFDPSIRNDESHCFAICKGGNFFCFLKFN